MITVITIIHATVCIFLILVVLLQAGKGGGMGIAFGGGSSQTVFGSSGASTFLQKITAITAGIFMLTSVTLAWFASESYAWKGKKGKTSTAQKAGMGKGPSSQPKSAPVGGQSTPDVAPSSGPASAPAAGTIQLPPGMKLPEGLKLPPGVKVLQMPGGGKAPLAPPLVAPDAKAPPAPAKAALPEKAPAPAKAAPPEKAPAPAKAAPAPAKAAPPAPAKAAPAEKAPAKAPAPAPAKAAAPVKAPAPSE